MRIWAYPSFYPFDSVGTKWRGIFAHRQYKGLVEKGADLKVLLPTPWVPVAPFSKLLPKWKKFSSVQYPNERIYDGINVYHPVIANFLPHRFEKKDYKERYFDSLVQFFKSKNIQLHPSTDIFYSQWLPESFMVQYAAHKFGLKSAILSIGDDVVVWPHSSKANFEAFEQLMTEADMRFACADYLGAEANKILGKELSYDVVNWGVDYEHFKPTTSARKFELKMKFGFPADKIAVLNVGSAIERKGWLDLMDALQIVKRRTDNFVLVAVHAGETTLDLTEEARKRGLESRFFNMGEVPPEKLDEVFNAVDVFCLPSHWEGLANANIEAMSSGLPVITTNVCGHPELVKDNINGILLPPKQPEILAEKLYTVITDEKFRNELSKNGREFIVNKWGNFADNATLLYQKLCSQ
ncbi:MAG: glycosyltransferase family 4 protein [Taibaiella sp.]|nr:glycosyltransferase family 4 protein [Taibaiella sp.]